MNLPLLRPVVFVLLVTFGFAATDPVPAQTVPGGARRPRATPNWILPEVQGDNLHYKTFESKAAGTKVSYLIYLPPGYEESTEVRYPVVYWLHGIGGSQQGMPGFCERVTAAIQEGKAPAMIFVFVNGMVDSMWCDSTDGKTPVETVLIKDLIPHIDATYHTEARREGRMIEGFSMGGFGAMRFGFKYPGLFGSISSIDGALLGLDEFKNRHADLHAKIFGGSDTAAAAQFPSPLAEANADAVRGHTVIRQILGALKGPNEDFHALLDRLKIEHEYRAFPEAGHNHPKIYALLGEFNWAFYRKAFTALAAQPTQPAAAMPGSAEAHPRQPKAEPKWLREPIEGANLHYATFDSKAVGEKVSYLIYLPPGYEESGKRRYPVTYWLHGIGGAQTGVPAMAERLTGAINAGKTPPMIVVFVNGMIRSWYVDAANGKWLVETVTLKELVPHVDATYRTIPTREGRIIEGFSMGGAGTARWGFKHPEMFGAISILAGALGDNPDAMTRRAGGKSLQEIYGGKMANYEAEDPWKWTEKNADQVRGRTIIRVVVGDKDQLKGINERYHTLLEKLGLKHEFVVVPEAGHSPNPLYAGLGDRNWEFYRAALAALAKP